MGDVRLAPDDADALTDRERIAGDARSLKIEERVPSMPQTVSSPGVTAG